MSVEYWGGSTVQNKVIRRLDATCFRDMVEAYIFIPVAKGFTREEYQRNPETEQRKLKDAPYLCACSFVPDATRCDDNAVNVNLAILDLDERGGEFFESPESLADALHPWNFVAYTTASHTPEKPRIKIMVEVEPCAKKWHKPLVCRVIERLGLPQDFKGSVESKVLSQPQYRPIHFKGESFESVIASRTEGEPMTTADALFEGKEDDRTYAYESTIGGSLTSLPIPDLQVESIREPLMTIDPDCRYKQWTEVAASLRHQFRDEDSARIAYELFDEWSSAGTKYAGADETWAKWKSFRPDTMGKEPVTIRSLFRKAMDAGWDNRKVSGSLKDAIITWLEKCEDEDELMSEGPRRIAAMPFANAVVEEALARVLRMRIKEVTKGVVVIDKATMMKQIADEKYRKKAEKNKGEKPKWMQPFCYISTSNKFCNIITGVEMVPEAFNHTFSAEMMPLETDPELAKSGRPSVLPVHYALNQCRIPKVDGKIYDPRQGGEEPYFEYEGRRYLNTYMRSSLPEEDEENAEAAGALFTAHLEVLIGEKEYRKHVLDFIAHVVQKPGVKIPWAPIIQSAEGAGKGFLRDIMKAVLGDRNVKEVTSEVISDKWNDWMVGSVLSLLNEVHIPGQQREKVANSLKMFIADPVIPIMQRFMDVETNVPNITNSIAFSNYHDAMHMKASDRRWMPIESPLQAKEDIIELNESGHFDRIAILKNEWGGALRHWLLNHRISKDFPIHGPAPVTVYRQDVIDQSKNRLHEHIEELIKGDDVLIASDIIHEAHLENLTETMSRNNHRATHYLKSLGYTPYANREPFIIGETPTPIWVHRKRYDGDYGLAEEILAERWANRKDSMI